VSDKSAIEWCDATWNFLVGCSKVSEGCRNCYAIRSVKRMSGNPVFGHRYQGLVTDLPVLNWTGKVTLVEELLSRPLHWTRPRKIFVNSQSDLFHPDVPDEWIDKAFGVMARTPRHTYQILTKRPERMADYLLSTPAKDLHARVTRAGLRVTGEILIGDLDPLYGPIVWEWPLPNVWLGTSIEDQRAADERIPHLLKTPAAVRFLSCEPLLGPVDLRAIPDPLEPDEWRFDALAGGWYLPASDDGCPEVSGDGPDMGGLIDWVITGGESGPKHRPIDPAWARSLRDQCQAAGVAFFFKQWSGLRPKTHGRLLDGREHNDMPEPARVPASV
jgi:protein gp37